jgi:hypothetical protein
VDALDWQSCALREQTDDSQTHGGRTLNQPFNQRALLHHSPDATCSTPVSTERSAMGAARALAQLIGHLHALGQRIAGELADQDRDIRPALRAAAMAPSPRASSELRMPGTEAVGIGRSCVWPPLVVAREPSTKRGMRVRRYRACGRR